MTVLEGILAVNTIHQIACSCSFIPVVFRNGEDDTEVSMSRTASCTKLWVTWSHPEVVFSMTVFMISLIGTLQSPSDSALCRKSQCHAQATVQASP